MKGRTVAVLALLGSGGHSFGAQHNADNGPIDPGFDYHSYANVDQFRATHLELEMRVDLEAKTITGVAGFEFKRLDPRATQLVLDTKGLMINDVRQKATDVLGATAKNQTIWVSRPFHLEKPDRILGSALVIELPPSKQSTEVIRVDYETTPASSALQWLTPKQTAWHKPFLYTEPGPIGARTWIPLQDTPQVRVTYKAHVYTDSHLRALMSAENDPKAKRSGEDFFVMTQAVPSYRIALAVGDLEFKETGPRTGVYADRSLIKQAAKEFADAESMIQAGEKTAGPYRWNRFDILVMPPGFPVGGTANPRLAFISPTVIAGDKSLVAAIAHELAHSWSGNLVGNATWRDLWLNEGVGDYLQSRIMSALYGESRSSMEAAVGLQSLRADMAKLKSADQMLAVDLRDRDPGEGFSEIPYEKGLLFLNYLDAKFGRERFDQFLRGYFDHFAFKSITTEQFLAYLQENLLDRYPGLVSRQQANAWVFSPGLPAEAVLPATSMFQPVEEARAAWLAGNLQLKKFGLDWVAPQWLYFLDGMPASVSAAQLADLEKAFGFSRSPNDEIEQSWFKLAIAHDYQPSFARLEDYLKSIGRRKLVVPLYEALMQTPASAEFARRVFAKARPGYPPQTIAAIETIVTPQSEASE
ncbi:MAG TPA: M1 family metallopeptidase [Steroidobacteraceae bacterium]|jgi:leukotriene-A4 hydrolase|nr:M1 family metallopeptidase [Steroidobacteraceae bacterium]